MAIKIKFDAAHNPQAPTIVLAKKNGDKLGQLNAKEIEVSDSLNDASEITFTVYKNIDGKKCTLWDEIVDFKLVYCVEWNMWFEITVELDESNEIQKTVFCTQLGQAELSQIMLYDIEINTEDDIARDDYKKPTVLYDEKEPENSLLNRIMEKAPHYSISYVDKTIAGIQRTFTFDDTSIYDAFQDIAEEIGCLFVFPSSSDEHGNIQRVIDVYDLESNCRNTDCMYRGEFTKVCPECGSTDIEEGYGDDTAIFITSDELTDDIQLTTDADAVKNCFKLEAGDDLMTAAIRSCNPNGTDYIWYISDDAKKDMPKEMVDKIALYDDEYEHYMYNKVKDGEERKPIAILDSESVKKYNKLVDKYNIYKTGEDDVKIEKIDSDIYTYSDLMKAYYNTIDFDMYLEHTLMPKVILPTKTGAVEELKKIVDGFNSIKATGVAVNSIKYVSKQTADNAVLSMAKVFASSKYKIKVYSSELVDKSDYKTWQGIFELTNYSNEEDTARNENTISVRISDDVENFIKQKVEKALAKGDEDDLSITGLFKLATGKYDNDGNLIEKGAFEIELEKYSLKYLNTFYDSCRGALDILIEQGVPDGKTWSGGSSGSDLYSDLYLPYFTKYKAIESEMNLRQREVDTIAGVYKADGELVTYGMQNYIEDEINKIQKKLDFEDFMGKDLWLQFCAFRREDKYSNDNYISDGLDNAELFSKALEFIKVATKEIYKSAELQHSISASLKNLLTIKKFLPIVNDFQVGNWLRVMIDGELYKLRLTKCDIDYDDFDNISVEFSDAVKAKSNTRSIQEVLDQASSMATSYDAVQRQAEQGNSGKDMLNNWVKKGLSLTNMKIVSNAENQNITWDSHGLLCKEWLPIEEEYDDRQLKIINRGLYVTDNNWKTSRAGIGNFTFRNPESGKVEEHYGVIADTLVGSLVLSEKVGIYNENNSIKLDKNGLSIVIDANNAPAFENVIDIESRYKDPDSGKVTHTKLMYIDNSGNLVLNGSLTVSSNGGSTTLNNIASSSTEYTKYLHFDPSSGLRIGDTEKPTSILITDDKVKILNNSTEYASYGEECIIGQTSGNNVYITSDNGVRIRTGTTVNAQFGSTIRIGQSSGYNTYINSSSIRIGMSSGKNVYIDGDGVYVRNGSTVLSSFKSNEINLGESSSSATIKMAGGSILIKGTSGSNLGSFENGTGSGLFFHSGGFTWNGQDSYVVLRASTSGYSAAYGYHNSTLNKSYLDNILGAVTLYQSKNGQSSGTIYFSPSSSNYWFMSNNIVAIEIFYKLVSKIGQTRYCSQKIYDPDGKQVVLSYTTFRDNSETEAGTYDMYLGSSEILISLGVGDSGTGTISFVDKTCGDAAVYSNNSCTASSGYRIAILKVVGYR
jgi:hypothetical protein